MTRRRLIGLAARRWPAVRRRRLIGLAAGGLALAGLAGGYGFWRLGEGPDGGATAFSREVVDRQDRLLRPFQTDDDMWRFPGAVGAVDPLFLRMLKAYEDRRFSSHPGVDPLALGRAAGQWLANGRIVSGGSTLAMQVARLIDKREDGRSLFVKLREMARAVRLRQTLGEERILDLYLSLAPYGGNVEGIRAASLAYFGKEPRRLSPGEAALLVALPQAPETRRPDRFPERARRARDRVLDRMLLAGVLKPEQVAAGKAEHVPTARRAMPAFAWHASAEAVAAEPGRRVHRLTLDRGHQEALEALVRERARAAGAKISAGLVAIDHRSGEVIARIGAADPLDTERQGAVDMTRAIRSPGSALKPFIYALAYEAGLAHPETLIEDRPQRFGSYAPVNFDRGYQGTVSTRNALQMSLNVPAVALLEAVGPQRFMSRLEQAGVRPALPRGEVPGLAIGLGGVGLRLVDLAALYAGLARLGDMPALIERRDLPAPPSPRPLAEEAAAWAVGDILTDAPAPESALTGRYAYKTGTSYGFRDAWAIGFDGQRTIAVWVGRPDGSSIPGLIGRTAAAPILFDAFARLGPYAPLPGRPAHLQALTNSQLPPPLRRFGAAREEAGDTRELKIAFPPDGVRIDLGAAAGPMEQLPVRTVGGRPPFTVLVDGRPVARFGAQRQANVAPDGPGFTTLSVIDAEGRSASVTVRVE
ncbi:Penicillin-binding protein 1F [bacterium YEK0313]|nr:Penicillin-binding protein 1F [bacterium YEK0313]